MNRIAWTLLVGALFFSTTPAHAAKPMAYRYSDSFADGWPKWIGRLDARLFAEKQRPELAAKYLPLSLIRTGGFEKLVKEVMETPGFVESDWPSWIGEVQTSSH